MIACKQPHIGDGECSQPCQKHVLNQQTHPQSRRRSSRSAARPSMSTSMLLMLDGNGGSAWMLTTGEICRQQACWLHLPLACHLT